MNVCIFLFITAFYGYVFPIASCAGGVGSIPGVVKLDTVSPTACHRLGVSTEMCCLGVAQSHGDVPRLSLHASA